MSNFKIKSDEICFKEQPDGTFKATNGWTILRHESVEDRLIDQTYSCIDPNGEKVDEIYRHPSSFTIEGKIPRLKEVNHKSDRVTWSPAHFTKGSIITANKPSVYGKGKNETFTVDRVVQNGVTSFCVESKEKQTEGYFAGEPHSFNICYVIGFISRRPGVAVINTPGDQTSTGFNDFKLHNGYIEYNQLFNVILHDKKLNTKGISQLTYVDSPKVYKRLKAMGLIKVRKQSIGSDVWGIEKECIFVKFKEAKKYLTKNPHWMLETVKRSLKIEEELWTDEFYHLD